MANSIFNIGKTIAIGELELEEVDATCTETCTYGGDVKIPDMPTSKIIFYIKK